MWLLSTDRAELRWFTEAGSVPGGYAILSHTWGTDEQTLQDVRAINKRYESSGKNPRDFVSSKIRNCCLLAEKYRYRWVWIDSCCIDKTSSTELSEAINSMFKWYWQAEVCFAFLADVPSEDDLRAKDSAFRKSRWHKRGWTLQELIAPAVVIFFSNHWVQLGTKAELAELLEEVTRIPQCILTRQEYYHHTSVANRMSWAANRMTTRVEDQAYCLMGLFNVNMTVIYGEGTRAFRRLQHKIMKHGFSDMSLFAWGRWLSSSAFGDQGLELERNCLVDLYDDSSYLLAPSPSSFLAGFDFTPAHPHPKQHYPPPNSTGEENAPDLRVPFDGPMEVPTATPNNYGTICRLPVFEADGVTVAVLLCENLSHEQIGLLIHHDRDDYDPIRPMHFIGAAFNNVDDAEQEVLMSYRLVTLGDDLYNLQFNGKPVRARWRTMYIQAERQVWFSPQTSIARLQLNCAVHPAFRIPHWLMARFSMFGFQLLSLADSEDGLPLRLLLSAAPYGEFIHLDLGLCQRRGPDGDRSRESRSPAHWAKVQIHHDKDLSAWLTPYDEHDCEEHHIADWSGNQKLFGDAKSRAVQLSFAECQLAEAIKSPSRTLAIHIELKGPVYTEIVRDHQGEAMQSPKLPDLEHIESHPTPETSIVGSALSAPLIFVAGAALLPLIAWRLMTIVRTL